MLAGVFGVRLVGDSSALDDRRPLRRATSLSPNSSLGVDRRCRSVSVTVAAFDDRRRAPCRDGRRRTPRRAGSASCICWTNSLRAACRSAAPGTMIRSVSSSWATVVVLRPRRSRRAAAGSSPTSRRPRAASASNSSRVLPCASSSLLECLLVVVEAVDGVVTRAVDLGLDDASGSGTSTVLEQRSSTLSRAGAACSIFLTRPTRSRRSARSSSTVSNSLASWANSSSASGSSRSLTEFTLTVTSASSPAYSPATSVG